MVEPDAQPDETAVVEDDTVVRDIVVEDISIVVWRGSPLFADLPADHPLACSTTTA